MPLCFDLARYLLDISPRPIYFGSRGIATSPVSVDRERLGGMVSRKLAPSCSLDKSSLLYPNHFPRQARNVQYLS